MSREIQSGGMLPKDPDSIEVYEVNWDRRHLATGVTITSSDWFIEGPDSALTGDQETVLTGSRRTTIRLTAGTLNKKYRVTNRIVTNETPSQTKDAFFDVKIEHN